MTTLIQQGSCRVPRLLSKRIQQISRASSSFSHTAARPSVQHAMTESYSLPAGSLSLPGRSNPSTSLCTRLQAPRSFRSSSSKQSRAIINPKKDDDGNDMLVDISARASNRLHAIAQKDNNPSLCLRVTVESGGCHGFQYLMSLTTLDQVSQEEDTVFESEDGQGAKVVLDEPSLELLKGSKIDYTMELIGSQFKVTGIPGAKSSCGCGTSFDIQA